MVSITTGFRRIEVRGDAWLVSGRRIRLRGVNRQDFDPRSGRVTNLDDVREAMVLMKRHNLNAIRTAHYPPAPGFLALADELGFWVILENDVETHGFELVGWEGNPSDDPQWRTVYLDRMERTLERDKNHPCVVAWSLGNESGTGENFKVMAEWIRRRDPSRPVHYEGDQSDSYVDIVSRMYAPLEELERLVEARPDMPIIECEYLHAMGNGSGAAADYEYVINAHPAIHGGFVWEWRDHGLLTEEADGTPFYAYGGDFGEPNHDGSFVCDGMLLADGTVTPMLTEYAAVVTPIRITVGDGIIIENLRHDGDTSDLEYRYRHEVDGESVAAGRLDVPVIEAGESATVGVPSVSTDEPGEHWLTMGLGAPGPSSAARWREAGLDKLQTRVVSVKADEDALTFVRRIAPASQNISIEVTQRWSWSDDGLRCEVRVEPSEGWTVTWPRAGVHFELPLGYETASWFGTRPEENYPDSQAAAIVSGFSSPIDDLGVRYAVPQETGHRGDLRKLRLQGSDLSDVVVTTELVNGRRPGFSVTRHTPDVVAGASHLHRLPEPTATHLWLDLAVHGLGSRSCGPDVLPKYALWPRVLEGTFTLSAQ